MLLDERQTIVEFGKELITSRLTTGSGGNLSIYNRAQGLIAIKPSGVDYLKMQPEDIVILNSNGEVVEGDLKPSSELRFHLELYRHRADINAIVHTHQVYATTIACMNWELPAVHYLVGYSGDKVPIAKYAAYGTQELSNNIIEAIGNYQACLMANHGIVTVGSTLQTAFETAEQLELVSQIYYQCKCMGEPKILSTEEMNLIAEKFKHYGQPKSRTE